MTWRSEIDDVVGFIERFKDAAFGSPRSPLQLLTSVELLQDVCSHCSLSLHPPFHRESLSASLPLSSARRLPKARFAPDSIKVPPRPRDRIAPLLTPVPTNGTQRGYATGEPVNLERGQSRTPFFIAGAVLVLAGGYFSGIFVSRLPGSFPSTTGLPPLTRPAKQSTPATPAVKNMQKAMHPKVSRSFIFREILNGS